MNQKHRLSVIAKVGNHYRSLAAVLQPRVDGLNAAQQCVALLGIFSHPNNRIAIQQEFRYAQDLFRDKPAPPAESASTPWASEFKGRPSAFPYIASCLLHASSYTNEGNDFDCFVQIEAFHTRFDQGEGVDHITVVDITDLDNVKYCLVNLRAETEQSLYNTEPTDDDHEELPPTLFHYPLSAQDYLGSDYEETSSIFADGRELVSVLTEKPIVSIAALASAWPWGDWASHGPIPPLDEPSPSGPQGLVETAVDTVVRAVLDATDFAQFEAAKEQFEKLPSVNIRALVKGALVKHSAQVVNTRPSIALLAWAYEGEKFLDWAPFVNLSAAALRFAFENLPPQSVTSINLSGTAASRSPEDLWPSLAAASSLQSVYFLEPPVRSDDTTSVRLFKELVNSNVQLPLEKVMLSGLISYGLEGLSWLADDKSDVDLHPAFPVVQLLTHTSGSMNYTLALDLEYFFVGDALLSPIKFVTGLMNYLVSLQAGKSRFGTGLTGPGIAGTGFDLGACLTAASSSLNEFEPGEVGMIPAQVRQISKECSRVSMYTAFHSDMRDLIPGQWTVLLKRSNQCILMESGHRFQVAFVRPRVRINLPDPTSTARVPINENDLDVYRLEEFLRDTLPGFNIKDFTEAISMIADQEGTTILMPMAVGDACTMLETCMRNAHKVREIRENLHLH